MKTWLLTWNPKRYAWDEAYGGFNDLINQMAQLGHVYGTWSTGVNKSIKEGDRVFLIRLGKEPRGIVLSGYAASNVFVSPHWEEERAAKGERSRHVYIKIDKIVKPKETPLPMSLLKEISPNFKWSSQASGINIPYGIAIELERIWQNKRNSYFL